MPLPAQITPIHLDYTTLYGAALCVEPKAIAIDGVKLSRLLSLSQFIEALVLHENIQFEVGATADWEHYNDALRKTNLLQIAPELGLSLEAATLPIGSDEDIIEAFQWAGESIKKSPAEAVDFAVRHRPGSYSSFPQPDRRSPMVKRYFQIAQEADGSREQVNLAIRHLANIGIDHMGLYVAVRVRLLQQYFDFTHSATYLPHYSRQPMIVSFCTDENLDVYRWTMELLRERRNEILRTTNPKREVDLLANFISPIFTACIAQARRPIDIVQNAIEIRNSDAAKRYRQELFELLQKFATEGQKSLQLYKFRVFSRMKELNDVLFEQGVKQERVSQWSLSSMLQVGWSGFIRNTKTIKNQTGDQSITLLSDVLSHSLGTLQAEAKIYEVFGRELVVDCPIVGPATI